MVKKSALKYNEEKCTGCRTCQLICSFIHKQTFCPADAYIEIKCAYDLKPEIRFSEDCNSCGQCVNSCLYGALELKESSE